MKKLIILLLAYIFTTQAYAENTINGNYWLDLRDESKLSLIIGYLTGSQQTLTTVSTSLDRALMLNVNTIKYPDIKNAEEAKAYFDSEQSDKDWAENSDKFNRVELAVKEAVKSKHLSPFSYGQIQEQMDYLYQEPATRVIPWYFILQLAQQRLAGQDIQKHLDTLIKVKPWQY
ncbi:hypothetical protein ACS86_05510 [Vibrio alginolyticus]|nr:hypothetical protein ACS86_05510 [Vibrio alginolyticus]